jgi:UDP-N-acetylmuramyl pentapeptide phosphotransferase/UDP-N-acetylglucosamine-1-phosphate transferase
MIAFFLSMPIIAYLSLISFQTMKLGVLNYEGRFVPYSLGVVIIYSYSYLFALSPGLESVSMASFIFVFSIWLLGLVDDVFGKPYPKGLKGHVLYAFQKKRITTGLVKAAGTIVVALLFVWMTPLYTYFATFLSLFLLIGLPHVMNLFDTRPLRVWKGALCFVVLVLLINPLPSFIYIVMLLSVFYVWYVLEGYRKAMLGDNGATVVGAILAVVAINHLPIGLQLFVLVVVSFFIVIAEKYSFSTIIEHSSLLRMIDQIGIMNKHQKGDSHN